MINQFQNIPSQFSCKAHFLSLINDDDLDVLNLAKREHQLSAWTQQTVFVQQHQAPDLALEDHFQQRLQSLFLVVHPAAEIQDDLEVPLLRRAVGLEQFCLGHQVFLLVMTADAGIADGRRALIA